MIPENVKIPLRKALEAVAQKPSMYPRAFPYKEKGLTVYNLEAAADNHFFDDDWKILDISEADSHTIRDYFETASHDGYRDITELHQEFAKLLEPEPQQYLDRINSERRRMNLPCLDSNGAPQEN